MLTAVALLGAGFMLVEVPLIQRFQLLLGYPVLSLAATVLGGLLLAERGAGSLVSQRWAEPNLRQRVTLAALWIAGVGLLLLVGAANARPQFITKRANCAHPSHRAFDCAAWHCTRHAVPGPAPPGRQQPNFDCLALEHQSRVLGFGFHSGHCPSHDQPALGQRC